MSERSREKIALVVFALLVAFAGCCLGGYIVAGHSWNVAATNIDDTFGSLDGYTVIAYAGTVEQKKAPTAASSADQANPAGQDDTSKGSSAGLSAGESSGSESSLSSAANEQGEQNEKGEQDERNEQNERDEQDADSPSSFGSGQASGAANDVSSSGDADEAISADEVRQSYEDKGATVFLLDTEHLGRYSEGTILEKGGHRFGVFSIEKPMTLLNLKRMVRYFERHEVDFIVAIVADNRLLEDAEGIDIVVSTKDENLFAMGETKNGTFYVNAPEAGKVGAVLISPSNVVSAKVIDSL